MEQRTAAAVHRWDTCHHRAFEISTLQQRLDTHALRRACIRCGLPRHGTNVERAERLHDNAHSFVLQLLRNEPDAELERFVPFGDTDVVTCDRSMAAVHHTKITVHTAERDYRIMARELTEMNKRTEFYMRDIFECDNGLQELIHSALERQELLDQSRCDLRRAADLVVYYGMYVFPMGVHMTREDGSIVFLAEETFAHVANAISDLRAAAGDRLERYIREEGVDSFSIAAERTAMSDEDCRRDVHVLLQFSTRMFCTLCFETVLLLERIDRYPHWDLLRPKTADAQFDDLFKMHGLATLFTVHVEKCFLALEDVLIGDVGLDRLATAVKATADLSRLALSPEINCIEHIRTRREEESLQYIIEARSTRLLFDILDPHSRQKVLNELECISPKERYSDCISKMLLRWQTKRDLGIALQD